MPPAATATNCPATDGAEPALPPTAAIAILYAVSAVPSLTSDSPSRIVFERPLTPSRSSTAAADTGSVGPSTAPSTNAAAHGMPSTALATAATAQMVAITRPTASSVIGAQLARSSCAETAIAAAYSSGGRKTKKTTSGSSSGEGRPGTRPITSPPSTSATGYGTPLRRPRPASTATANSRKTNSSISATGIIYPRRAVFSRRPWAALPASAHPGAPGAGVAGPGRDARGAGDRPRGADRPGGARERRGAAVLLVRGERRVAVRARSGPGPRLAAQE